MYTNSGSIDDAEGVLGEFSEENTLPKNAMISGYLSEGHVDKARKMFDNTAANDAASWSALITGYIKNGMHAEALALFQDTIVSHILPNEAALKMPQRNIVTRGLKISASAIYGQAKKCFQLFDEMLADGIHLNKVIFVAMLSSCSYAGCVEEGRQYFSRMKHDFGIRRPVEAMNAW
ncbi:hypothetical protein Peur_060432 [Populus x canadensis]